MNELAMIPVHTLLFSTVSVVLVVFIPTYSLINSSYYHHSVMQSCFHLGKEVVTKVNRYVDMTQEAIRGRISFIFDPSCVSLSL